MNSVRRQFTNNPTATLVGGAIGALLGGVVYHFAQKIQNQTTTTETTIVATPEGTTTTTVTKVEQIPQQPETRTLRVAVTGAAGQIAYSFLPMLASGQVFGPNVLIELRLLDIPQAEKGMHAVKLELEDGAYPTLVNVHFGTNPFEIFDGADVVVFLGGYPRKQGQERKELLAINGKIFKEQGEALNLKANKNVKCLVVANPANTNCLILQRNAPDIPRENFSCLTRLDHNRALSQLATRVKVPVTQVRNVIIWGNHSATQYPDVNHGTINGEEIRKVIGDDDFLNTDFITRVQKRGAEIIAIKGTSSVFSAANAVKDHLRDWYHGTKEGEWTSMGVVTVGTAYNIPEGLVYSYPVTCKNFEYQIVKGLKLDHFSKEKLQVTLDELLAEKRDAFGEDA